MKLKELIPMQPVKDLATSIAFYQKLGFVVEQRNDPWRWAMLRFGDVRLMLDQSINVHPGFPRMTVLYLYPDDIVAFHAAVRAKGLPVPELDTTFYGMTEFRITDPDGNPLWIGQERTESQGEQG